MPEETQTGKMDTRGEKVHKRMVICGSCGRLEEEKEEEALVGDFGFDSLV